MQVVGPCLQLYITLYNSCTKTLLYLPHTTDTSVVSAGVTNSLCVSPGQILRDVAEGAMGDVAWGNR